jgi:hypothetical protein
MAIKTFRSFREELINPLTVTFGRFQPPTVGHEKLISAVAKFAKGDPYRIYTSQTNDTKKNPLSYEDKIKYLRKMFPKHGRQIISDKNVRNIFDVADKAYTDGFTLFRVVVGSDRVNEFKTLLAKYNNKKRTPGFYNFKHGIEVKSAGQRDPDAEGVTGMSASKMRAAAADNDLQKFTQGLPKGFGDVANLFNAIRVGMGLKESLSFRKHIEISSDSESTEMRNRYLSGEIFNEGDVVIAKDEKEYIITKRLTNHVECSDNTSSVPNKFFINDLKKKPLS